MPILFWDASALAKRYVPEVGSATARALFSVSSASEMAGTVLGYAETFSILLRHSNRGTISATTWRQAKTLLRAEIVDDPDFTLLTVDDAARLEITEDWLLRLNNDRAKKVLGISGRLHQPELN